MTVKTIANDTIVQDAVVLYNVTTPATLVNPDGSKQNFTNTISKVANLGLMQPGDSKDLTFSAEHAKNVPATITVTIKWRGGSAKVFETTLNAPDHNIGTREY